MKEQRLKEHQAKVIVSRTNNSRRNDKLKEHQKEKRKEKAAKFSLPEIKRKIESKNSQRTHRKFELKLRERDYHQLILFA